MTDLRKFLSDLGFEPSMVKGIPKKILQKKESKSSGIIATGLLEIYKVCPDKPRELLHSGKNVIVDNGLKVMARILGTPPSPDSYADTKPTRLAVGTDNTPPAKGQTNLGAQVWIDYFDDTVFPTDASTRFEMIMGKSEGNGLGTFYEAGLKNDHGDGSNLITRQIFDAITKNSSFELSFQWTITFNQA